MCRESIIERVYIDVFNLYVLYVAERNGSILRRCIGMGSIVRDIAQKINHWYFVYVLRTSLYMLEPWEKRTFSIL